MSKIRIGYLIEHIDREAFLFSTLQKKIKECFFKAPIKIDIISIPFNLYKGFFTEYDLIITPYLPNKQSPFGALLFNFVSRGGAVLVLHWEQYLSEASLFYKSNSIKQFCQYKSIYHVSWHDGFTDFLVDYGVEKTNILLWQDYNVFQLLHSTGRPKELKRDILKYDGFIFFPLNYAWAFASDVFVENRVRDGYSIEIANNYINYSQACLKLFLKDLVNIALKKPNVLFLVRPHPSISVSDYYNFSTDMDLSFPENIKISKEGDARDFLLLADFVVSSWSTLALHRYIIDKKSALFTPIFRPKFLEVTWNKALPNITSLEELFKYVDAKGNRIVYDFYKEAPWSNLGNILKANKVMFVIPYKDFRNLFFLFCYNVKNQLKYKLSLLNLQPKIGVLFDHPSLMASFFKSEN